MQDVLGKRICAALIDGVVFGVVFVILAVTIGDSSSGDGNVNVSLSGLPATLWVGLIIGYYIGFEGTSGQTPGKRVMGVKVVRADGAPMDVGPAAIRTVLRIVDVAPFLYLVGFICVMATGPERRERVGDIAAKTRVVAA